MLGLSMIDIDPNFNSMRTSTNTSRLLPAGLEPIEHVESATEPWTAASVGPVCTRYENRDKNHLLPTCVDITPQLNHNEIVKKNQIKICVSEGDKPKRPKAACAAQGVLQCSCAHDTRRHKRDTETHPVSL